MSKLEYVNKSKLRNIKCNLVKMGLISAIGITALTGCGKKEDNTETTSIEYETHIFIEPTLAPTEEVIVENIPEEIPDDAYQIPLASYTVQPGDSITSIVNKLYFENTQYSNDERAPYYASYIIEDIVLLNGYVNSKDASNLQIGQILKVYDREYLLNNPDAYEFLVKTDWRDYINFDVEENSIYKDNVVIVPTDRRYDMKK